MRALWLLALASCTSDIERVHLLPPALSQYQSMVVAADEDNERGFRMIAARAGDPIEIPSADPIELHLAAYDQTLEELDLAPGPISSSPCRRYCARLSPKAVFIAEGSPDALEWMETELPESIAERLVESPGETCGPCRTYEQESHALEGEGWPQFADVYGDGALVGLESGELIEVRTGASFLPRCKLPPVVRTGAYEQSTLVVALQDGRVLRIDDLSGESCSSVQIGTVVGFPVRLAISKSGPLEVYVFTNDEGEVMLWRAAEGETSMMLHSHVVPTTFVRDYEQMHRGAVVWLGPGHVLFAAGDSGFYRLKDGVVAIETLEVPEPNYRVQSLLATPAAMIAGIQPWGVAVASGSTWRATYGSPDWSAINVMAEHDGVVIVGQEFNLEYFDPGSEDYCPKSSHIVQSRTSKYMARLSEDELLVADQTPGDAGVIPQVRVLTLQDNCD